MRLAIAVVAGTLILGVSSCSEAKTEAPPPTTTAEDAANEPEEEAPTVPAPPTPTSEAEATTPPSTSPAITNRADCAAIQGTPYLSEEERGWFQVNCVVQDAPAPQQPEDEPQAPAPSANCDPSYPTVCIPPAPPDLDCGDISYRRFTVVPPDPHGFDGNDNDGLGCESG
jgi:hypothetical protein